MGSAFLYKYPLQRACILIIDEMLIGGLSKLDIVSERLYLQVLYLILSETLKKQFCKDIKSQGLISTRF